MMLQSQEQSIEYYTCRYKQLKERIFHDSIQAILKLKPPLVVYTAGYTALAVSIQEFICDQINKAIEIGQVT